MLESPVQLELRLVKLNKTSAPNPTTCTSSTNSLSSSRSSAHTPDLLDDLLNENPFLSPEQSFQSSSNASVKSRQTNILSFLSSPSTSSSERSSNERTPQGIVTKAKNSCSLKSSRALFPPVSSKSMKQRYLASDLYCTNNRTISGMLPYIPITIHVLFCYYL